MKLTEIHFIVFFIVQMYPYDGQGQNEFSFQHDGETPEWMRDALLHQAMQ